MSGHTASSANSDPTHRLNAGVVNLDRAARNAHGNVEYQSNFGILKAPVLAQARETE